MNGMACVVAVAIALGALARPCPAAAKAEPARAVTIKAQRTGPSSLANERAIPAPIRD